MNYKCKWIKTFKLVGKRIKTIGCKCSSECKYYKDSISCKLFKDALINGNRNKDCVDTFGINYEKNKKTR